MADGSNKTNIRDFVVLPARSRLLPAKPRREPGSAKRISKACFTQVVVPQDELEEFVHQRGFQFHGESHHYSVSISANASKEIRVYLSPSLDFVCASHRAVRWFAASLITTKNDVDPALCPDCVYYLNTEEPLSPSEELKIKAGGTIIHSIETGHPVRIGINFTNRILMIRHHNTRTFTRVVGSTTITVEIARIEFYNDFSLSSVWPNRSVTELNILISDPHRSLDFIQPFWEEGLAFLDFLKRHSRIL